MSGFDAVALAELPVLYRVARRMTLDATVAEDLVSQTLLRAATGWPGFDGRHPRSWLIRIMHNVHSRDMNKLSAKTVHVTLDDATVPARDTWHDVDVRLISSSIVAELDRIPEEYRLAVTLCDMEELSYDEAAEAMGVPVGTVRSRLYRGRHILRERLAAMIGRDDSYEGRTPKT
ncbi:MAG: RNA polymerase sigma factor [Fimbriimonadaceae bacterium]